MQYGFETPQFSRISLINKVQAQQIVHTITYYAVMQCYYSMLVERNIKQVSINKKQKGIRIGIDIERA